CLWWCAVGRRQPGGVLPARLRSSLGLRRLGLGGRSSLGGGGGLSSRSLGSSVTGEELALPLGERLGRRLGGAGLAGRTLEEALGDGVGDHAGQQRDGTDGVVVARDLVVDDVRVAVRVE